MSETSLEPPTTILESEKLDNEPQFLNKLGIDHPTVANEIRSRIPEWKKKVDELSGIEDFGAKMLNAIEYVDKEETDRLISSVADEIRKIREKDPTKPIRFIAWSTTDGSGKWFYDQLVASLQDISTDNISLIAPYDVGYEADLKAYEPTYFYLDDAANSGQQIQQGVFAFRSVVGNLEYSVDQGEDENAMIENPIDVRIRLLRVTDEVTDFINRQKKFFINKSGHPLVVIDTESNPNANKRMPTVSDLITNLGLKADDIQNYGAFLYGHHGRFPTTLAIFRHKIQDNMPIALVEGRLSSDKVPFLISQENRKSIRKFYK